MLGALAWGLGTGASGTALVGLALFLALATAESSASCRGAGTALAAAAAGARRLFQAADAARRWSSSARQPDAPPAMRSGWKGLSAVSAAAPTGPPVFENLELDVPEGARLARSGPSGAGEVQPTALLLKLSGAAGRAESPSGGLDTTMLAAEDLRRRIACLTQDARLIRRQRRRQSPHRRAAGARGGAVAGTRLGRDWRPGAGAAGRAQTRCGEGGAPILAARRGGWRWPGAVSRRRR